MVCQRGVFLIMTDVMTTSVEISFSHLQGQFTRAILTAILGAIFSVISMTRKNSQQFYSDFGNSRHCNIADVLNMFKFHRDIGTTFVAETSASKIAVNVNIVRVKGPGLTVIFDSDNDFRTDCNNSPSQDYTNPDRRLTTYKYSFSVNVVL